MISLKTPERLADQQRCCRRASAWILHYVPVAPPT